MKKNNWKYWFTNERLATSISLLGVGCLMLGFSLLNAPPQYEKFFEKNAETHGRASLPQSPDLGFDDKKVAQKSELRLIFAGDLMSQRTQIESAMIGRDETNFDFRPMLRPVAPVIQAADLAIGNLEFTTPGKGPYTGYPHFRTPDQAIEAVSWAGFDVMTTANNHVNDGGLLGVNHTIDVLRRNKIHQTGSFKNGSDQAVFAPLIIYKNGFKIALINYTLHTNGITTTTPAHVNRLDLPTMKREIQTAKQFKPDCIIAFLHWGVEYQLVENADQRNMAHQLHAAGANLVIGAHPHVVQPVKWEKIKKNDGQIHDCLTAYSLGNFMSDQPYENTEGGLLLELSLVRDAETGACRVARPNYIPVYRHTELRSDGRKKIQILPISAYETDMAQQAVGMSAFQRLRMKNFADKLRFRLAPHGIEERRIAPPQYQPVSNPDF